MTWPSCRISSTARRRSGTMRKSPSRSFPALREQIEALNKEIEVAQRNYDLNKAAELQYGELPKLQKQLEIEEEQVHRQDMSLVHESVTEEEIERIISRWTGIPVAKLTQGERAKILALGRRAAQAGRWSGRRCHEGDRGDSPVQGRYQGSDEADWLVPVLRTDRCRQDRAGKGTRREPLR